MDFIRIAQLSDIHISHDGSPVRGLDVRAQLLSILAVLKQEALDLLVFSGDLAASDGEPGAYRWLQQQMDDFPVPVLYMVGNHDRLAVMREHLNFTIPSALPDVHCFAHRVKQHLLLFLDTGSYLLSQAQIDWLRDTCAQHSDNILLFIHHPPLFCGCGFMDHQHALGNREEVWAALHKIPNIQHIFCGHYHTERTVSRDGKNLYITPSTMMQISTHSNTFSVDHTHPGWRMIEWDGSQLLTHVHYHPSIADTTTSVS